MIKGLYKPFEHWGENTCWIISDTHFDDPDLIHPYPDRPTAEEQVKLINSKVGKNDTLIILGDVGNIEWVRRLRGYKVLIMGNHDAGASNYLGKDLFQETYSGPVMIGEKLILSHEPIENCDWCMNIHGHTHDRNIVNDDYHFNVCADVINYTPINFNRWMKEGYLAKVKSLHRQTIDEATDRRRRRGYKLGG